MQYSQSRRDDMESLLFVLVNAAVNEYVFGESLNDRKARCKERNEFLTKPNEIVSYKSFATCESYQFKGRYLHSPLKLP